MGSGEGVGVDGISDDEEEVPYFKDHLNHLKDHFCAEVFKSESGAEYMNDADMVFLCSSFGGRHFKELRSHGKLIVGPSIVRTCAAKSKPLIKPQANRPLYSDSMAGITVALVGIPKKKCLEAVDLVHFMGGSTRRKFSPSVTHLISESAMGAEYRAAVSRRCSVVHLKWLNVAWALRNNVGASVTAIDFVKNFLVEPFCGLSIWFLGYSEDELVHLRRAVVEHS
ncbi:unnamed protein product [Toxocara canis]|uniref:BRCT domain-containing protein n=1 Tax=Toxocara canis TaxID=6265 RepID=A0A183TXN8_TOXCA|nr:unnamed protein product [Toxocara canis]